MAIYLLNISVDVADPNPNYIPEDLSYNDQESIVEIFVEKILGNEDAFKEYDDHDTGDHHGKKNVKIELIAHCQTDQGSTCGIYTKTIRFRNPGTYPLSNGFIEIDSPPPKG